MNVNTRELRLFVDGEKIPEGFVPLTPDEHAQAIEALNGNSSTVLPKEHPLFKAVKSRALAKRNAKRKAAKASRKANRR